MEGPDIRAHLVAVFGLRHQHASDEGAQRQARPASSVSQARPRVMSSRFSMNSSSLLRRATRGRATSA